MGLHFIRLTLLMPYVYIMSGESLRYKSAVHEDNARVDIRAAGFWNCRHHCSFFDVRVFNAFAESNLSSSPAATFRRHEGKKVELMRSVYERWKRLVLLLLCSLLQGAWENELLQ